MKAEVNTKEIWKDIPDYNGLYQVSNIGRVRSFWYDRERILKPTKNDQGYYYVKLHSKSKKQTRSVHLLMAISFLNHKPNGTKIVVNHINHNRGDNRLENLEIVSNRENCNKKHLPSKSKYTGVTWSSLHNKWKAQIYIDGKTRHLGLFKSEKVAAATYQRELALTI